MTTITMMLLIISCTLAIFTLLLIVHLIRENSKLNVLKDQNPLTTNGDLRSFVYEKPQKGTQHQIIELVGRINVVNAALGSYELLVVASHTNAKAFFQYFNGNETKKDIFLLQEMYEASYLATNSINGESYYVYKLTKIPGLLGSKAYTVDYGHMCNLHILL